MQLRAWSKYRLLQSKLVRNELVPQIVRIGTGAEAVLRFANEDRFEVSVWSSSVDETIAAVSPRMIERLRSTGISAEVIYDSIADWQKARAQGDEAARAVTPD